MFGTVGRLLFGMYASYINDSPWLYSPFQLPANAHAEKQQVMALVSGSLSLMGETQTEFWAPNFNSAQHLLLWSFVE